MRYEGSLSGADRSCRFDAPEDVTRGSPKRGRSSCQTASVDWDNAANLLADDRRAYASDHHAETGDGWPQTEG